MLKKKTENILFSIILYVSIACIWSIALPLGLTPPNIHFLVFALLVFGGGFLLTLSLYQVYILCRDHFYRKSINSFLANNKNGEAIDKLKKAINAQPKLMWLKGCRAVVLNVIGSITEFESYAADVMKLPGNNMKYSLGMLSMQNVNDYLSGRQLRNSEEIFSYYPIKKRVSYGPFAANVLVVYYYSEHYDWAEKSATSVLKNKSLFYKSIAASVLANISYKRQDAEQARNYAKMALENAPSEEMKKLLKNLHKDVLEKEDIK